MRSGRKQRKAEHAYLFLRSWKLSEHWGLVAMAPDQIPATATPDAWARALAAGEESLDGQAAEAAYRTALERWPDNALLLFATANSLYAGGRHDEAYLMYTRLLERQPKHVAARNNLGNLLLENGCVEDAAAEIRLAVQGLQEEDPLAPAVNDSMERARSALAAGRDAGPDCRIR